MTIGQAILLRCQLLLIYPLCLLAAIYAQLRMLYCIVKTPSKAWVLAIAHDQLANASFNGNPDETISSRANRAREVGRSWGCVLCRLLDVIDQDHCRRSAGV